MSEAERMVEPHAAIPRRPGHGGLGVVVKAETEVWESVRKLQPKSTLREQFFSKWKINPKKLKSTVLIFVEP